MSESKYHTVKIATVGPYLLGATVEIDGRPVKACTAVKFKAAANGFSICTISFVAGDSEIEVVQLKSTLAEVSDE